MCLISIIFYVFYVATQIATNIWLSEWSNDQPEPDGTQDTGLRDLRLGVYGGLGAAQGTYTFIILPMEKVELNFNQNYLSFALTLDLVTRIFGTMFIGHLNI